MKFDPREFESLKKDGKFHEAFKMTCQKNGGLNDYGKPKQHDYDSRGVVLSNVKAWRRRIEKTVGGRGYRSIGSDKFLAAGWDLNPRNHEYKIYQNW